MPIGIDIASKTVVLTELSDLAFIDQSLEDIGHEGPVNYTVLANTWAVALGEVTNAPIPVADRNGWAFGSTDHEVAKVLQSRLSGNTEIAEIKTGADIICR